MKEPKNIFKNMSKRKVPIKKVITISDEKDWDKGNDPCREYAFYSLECVLYGILLRMDYERAVQHCTSQDEKEINGKITALKDRDNVVEVPYNNYRYEEKAEELNAPIL